tara:strand:+ start:37 stop:933 length:897 start_codon:yes stop_codon:yes gene_type:complete
MMSENFKFKVSDENTILSLSGGRTSGYKLNRTLADNNDSLPGNCLAVFENTGKEKEATLEFIRDMGNNWDVDIVWLEYTGKKQYKQVDFETANRNGDPFEQLIRDKSMYLPNAAQRLCTIGLKSVVMSLFCKDIGWDSIENWVGIRADEPKRWGMEGVTYEKDKDGNTKYYADGVTPKRLNKIINEEKCLPMKYAGITKPDVLDFWKNNDFDLALGPNESNCNLCFMKGVDNILSEIRLDPDSADWWIEMEDMCSNHHGKPVTFRPDRPSYRKLKQIAHEQPDFFIGDTNNIPCHCTD